MNAKQAIKIINRRADTIMRLFGTHSEEYELFTTEYMAEYDIHTTSKGGLHIRNTAENRTQYRQLTAAAKRVQKTPTQVLKRQAEKKRTKWEKEFYGESTYTQDEAFKDYNAYLQWCNQFRDFYDSCYALAKLSGYEGRDAHDYAKYLYDNEEAYNTEWNFYYDQGDFSEYQDGYEEQHFYRENTVDLETGEVIPLDMYEDL